MVLRIPITHYTTREGGLWKVCDGATSLVARSDAPEDIMDAIRLERLHAVILADGTVYDAVNGKRANTMTAPTVAERAAEDPTQSGPELLAGRLIDAWCADRGRQIPWNTCIDIVAIITKMPEEEVKRLKDM